MTNDEDNFWDFLSEREAAYSDEAIRSLEGVPWAEPLIRTIQTNGGLRSANMAFLFELRFANALHQSGVTPEYETPGEGGSTLDFRFSFNNQTWQVELMRLLETQAARNATQKITDEDSIQWFGRQLATHAEDRRQSEEGETVQAVQRICQKCERDGNPYKFPAPGEELNVLLIDFRTFLHGGDVHDRVHVGLGGESVAGDFLPSLLGRPVDFGRL